MKRKLENLIIVLVLGVVIWLIDYNRVTACDDVVIYYKCHNYLEHYGLD